MAHISAHTHLARDPGMKATDASALRAIAQAAVNVELFTLPLYMSTLYSIHGMHQINMSGTDFYAGRQWPGSAAVAEPKTANEKVFNLIYSVFIQEMLHVQLAANIATAVGVKNLTFTSPALQTPNYGWHCYGPAKTVIPHIIDLTDTRDYEKIKVNVGPVSEDQLKLFLAIEESDDDAHKQILRNKDKYFPPVPFAGWTEDKTENDLPMFGTIGYMYKCYYDYASMVYSDGTTLWDYVFAGTGLQQDRFNAAYDKHPQPEYPGFPGLLILKDAKTAYQGAVEMMNAITDQGEGSTLKLRLLHASTNLDKVKHRYQSDDKALQQDYPSYDDSGKKLPRSAKAGARFMNDKRDHYERFQECLELLPQVVTWADWRKNNPKWTAKDLITATYKPDSNPYNLPLPDDIAKALNNLSADRAKNYPLMSHVVCGSLAGITTVLNSYWSQPGVAFPNPSMMGSGDRMAMCWVLFGEAPDLSIGIEPTEANKLYHACQSLDFAGDGTNSCAAVAVFHTCKGSNNCAAQGGCGFVHTDRTNPANFSAPSDNACKTYGGCAIPISASQCLPSSGTMQLYSYDQDNQAQPLTTMSFAVGEKVHDLAYKAYRSVMQAKGVAVPDLPAAPNDLRLAFPPST